MQLGLDLRCCFGLERLSCFGSVCGILILFFLGLLLDRLVGQASARLARPSTKRRLSLLSHSICMCEVDHFETKLFRFKPMFCLSFLLRISASMLENVPRIEG